MSKPNKNQADELAVVVVPAPFPDFEDEKVTEATLSASVTIDLRHPVGRHGKMIAVVELDVTDVAHKGGEGEGLKRQEKAKAATGYALPGRLGVRVLAAARHADRIASDGKKGRAAIDGLLAEEVEGDGLKVTTDGAGVVLTDADLADLGLDDDEREPVILGLVERSTWESTHGEAPVTARPIWPEEIGGELSARPDPGDYLTNPATGDECVVVELTDVVNGDTVGAWSWADEDARMLQAEKEAEALEDGEERTEVDGDELVEPEIAPDDGLTDGQRTNRQPWADYDDTKRDDLVKRLRTVERPALEHVVAYEEAHKNRATVLNVARRLLADLNALDDQVAGDAR